MSRLDNYRTALTVADPDRSAEALAQVMDNRGGRFAEFVIDHGLGPLWHLRTGRPEFRESRLAAEAKFLVQQHALEMVDEVLMAAGVEYVVIKGAANRLLLYDNPAVRVCHDIDLLVNRELRLQAAKVLAEAGFQAEVSPRNINHELVLSSRDVDIDLHWGIFREGRQRIDRTASMLGRRRRMENVWMLGAEDALYILLVHPVFTKHLAGYDMGLHRVLDVMRWLGTQSFDWPAVVGMLEEQGVRTAAWATLRWVQLLTGSASPARLGGMIKDLAPRGLRAAWLNRWLANDLSQRTARVHGLRLLAFSAFLHDTPADSVRALAGRYRAHHRRDEDLAEFAGLFR